MRKKRNNRNFTVNTEGYIKKYFGSDISRILTANDKSFQNCEIPYVPHPEAETVLAEYLIGDPQKDKSLIFTGLTGSGKTTILRHMFGLEQNACRSYLNAKAIVIPIDFNRSQKSAQDAILSSLRVAVHTICNSYGIDYPDINNYNFYEYIKKRREDFLELDAKHGRNTLFEERMEKYLEAMPTTFASCQLQYVMDQNVCSLELVILIIDNVEAFVSTNTKNSKFRYLEPVIEALRLSECINQRGESTKWCFNMIIACRHHIWRIMQGEYTEDSPETVLLQSYAFTERYDLSQPVNANDIIHKREEVLSRRQQDKAKWDAAVKVVNTVLDTMESSIGDFILQLVLKDLRKSFLKMQELILHRGLQKLSNDQMAEGAFNISSEDQFDLSRVNIIKTIGVNDRKYYSDSNNIIPNLLSNEQKQGMELYLLLTLKYFLIYCGYSEPLWDNRVSISEFYETMNSIFRYKENTRNKKFTKSVHYLIQHRLLLRSADQPQDEAPGLSMEDVKKIEYVYVSGGAIVLWQELGKSSALFQLFLDDVWLDENLDYFGNDGNDIEHCVKYLEYLCQIEKKIYNIAGNISNISKKQYLNCFGFETICSHLAKGLITSLETIIASNDLQSQNRIDMAKITLSKVQDISEKLKNWENIRQNQISK